MTTDAATGSDKKSGPAHRIRVIEVIDDDGDLSEDAIEAVLRAAGKPDGAADATATDPATPAEDEKPAAEDDGEEPAGEAGSGRAERPRRAARVRLPRAPRDRVRAALAVALAVMTAIAGVGVYHWHSLSAVKDERQALVKRVSAYGDAVGDFDYRNLQKSIDHSLSFLTGDALAAQRRSLVASKLQKEWTSKKLQLTSKTDAVYITEINGDMAGAVLVFDINAQSPLFGTGKSGPQPLLTKNHLTLGLVKRKGVWMVTSQSPAGNESAGSPVPGLTDPGDGSTSGTPSPSPSTSPSARN